MGCGVLLYGLAFLVSIDVAYRWFMGRSITGVYEVSEILLVAITFLAIAGVQAAGKQLNVDILVADVKGRKQAVLKLIDGVAALAFFLILVWTGFVDFRESITLGLMGNGIVKIPSAVPLGLVTVGSVMMVLTLLKGLFRDMRRVACGSDCSQGETS
jgi:TRAP-type C4-dicarboxylate transport system permease small subunit